MPKGDFEALVAELRPYISPNLVSLNHRAPNAEKKVAITLYYLKDTASIGMAVNSFGVANLHSCLNNYVISRLYSNKELIKCWTISLSHPKFFLFKFEVVSLVVGNHYFLNSNNIRMRTYIKIYPGRQAEVFIWISVHPAYRDLGKRDENIVQ